MLVGLFIGFSFLALIFLVVWSAVGEGSAKKNKAFLILLTIVAMWTLLLHFGISHPLGITAASCGLAVSVTALFVPFVVLKKKNCRGLPARIMEEIESRFIEEYLIWSDITYGPSLLGTMNDYNRLLMTVLDPLEEKYPEMADHYDEILSRLKEINPDTHESEKNT